MFFIKICGITSTDDARAAAQCGADAVGLNFHPASPRFVDAGRAGEIAAAVPPGVLTVGVFVNNGVDEIKRLAESVPLGAVQLHGEEPPELIAALQPLRIVRAVRLEAGDLQPALDYLSRCETLGAMPNMVLVDAFDRQQYGGTGKTIPWSRLAEQRHRLSIPLVLAGGLSADNVAEAIRQVRPEAVDTASGVEAAPGRKDHERMAAFVAAARGALRE